MARSTQWRVPCGRVDGEGDADRSVAVVGQRADGEGSLEALPAATATAVPATISGCSGDAA
jgi:hypothetical protein